MKISLLILLSFVFYQITSRVRLESNSKKQVRHSNRNRKTFDKPDSFQSVNITFSEISEMKRPRSRINAMRQKIEHLGTPGTFIDLGENYPTIKIRTRLCQQEAKGRRRLAILIICRRFKNKLLFWKTDKKNSKSRKLTFSENYSSSKSFLERKLLELNDAKKMTAKNLKHRKLNKNDFKTKQKVVKFAYHQKDKRILALNQNQIKPNSMDEIKIRNVFQKNKNLSQDELTNIEFDKKNSGSRILSESRKKQLNLINKFVGLPKKSNRNLQFGLPAKSKIKMDDSRIDVHLFSIPSRNETFFGPAANHQKNVVIQPRIFLDHHLK